ncbi:hypothetical protein WH52_05270 [Tenacibaculum holothuriorum]|uniref:Threonine synthase n=1 Tax=Tenacibaculum holothuriorum TaxID=1635173 RepID=A0A1Y2PCJ2_9FLAO|nr:DUF6503 family protein [Tenacibaculum holothuriorum]OSY88196.1 hypothetical protein WH52_05270 [Tenacibaculum holothuriorum]
MKKLIILITLTVFAFSCKKEKSKEQPQQNQEVTKQVKEDKFPKELGKVFEKHGGLKNWREAKTLSFKINGEDHTTDLHSRKSAVNAENYSLGFDGKNVWLHQKDSMAFKGNPEFYHNLYFYFYAMPFVLADDGIVYSETKPLDFEGVSYPGVKISYEANVGVSPDDNYYVYFDPNKNQMAWLGYTVTYFSKKPSEKFNIIRYNDWENVNGFLLPKSITWFKKDEEGKPLEPARDPIVFSDGLISQAPLADSFFEKPKQ